MFEVLALAIVNKTIGNSTYQYDVAWDRVAKKQIWKYIGKVSTNVDVLPSATGIGKWLTNAERLELRNMLRWIVARPHRQSGCQYHDIAEVMLDRFDL